MSPEMRRQPADAKKLHMKLWVDSKMRPERKRIILHGFGVHDSG
jgi:hypothetical protein